MSGNSTYLLLLFILFNAIKSETRRKNDMQVMNFCRLSTGTHQFPTLLGSEIWTIVSYSCFRFGHILLLHHLFLFSLNSSSLCTKPLVTYITFSSCPYLVNNHDALPSKLLSLGVTFPRRNPSPQFSFSLHHLTHN